MKRPSFFVRFMFYDSHSDKISHTKFWSNIGHFLACGLFAFTVFTNVATVELWFVFGTLVMGNATAHKLLNLKYGNKPKEDEVNDDPPRGL